MLVIWQSHSFHPLIRWATFAFIQDQYVSERSEITEGGPLIMNAFEMIALSQGLNLSPLFDRHQVLFYFHLPDLQSHGSFMSLVAM